MRRNKTTLNDMQILLSQLKRERDEFATGLCDALDAGDLQLPENLKEKLIRYKQKKLEIHDLNVRMREDLNRTPW